MASCIGCAWHRLLHRRGTRCDYDNADRLIQVTENAASGSCPNAPCNVITQYTYDRAGNRTRITDPLGHVRTFSFDAANEQTAATDALAHTTTWTYDNLGRMTNQGDPRGASNNLTVTYDGVDRPKTTAATNLAATITNNYDALGRRTSLVDSTGTTMFTPDALGRITQITAPNTGSINYTYDGRGLRTKLVYPTSGTTINYSYLNDGRLATVTQGTGSPLTQATYAYDVVGRLAQVATKDSTTPTSQVVTNYGYDGVDRLRALRTSEAGTTISGYQYQTDRLGLRTTIAETLPLSPTLSSTRIKTITFEAASLTDPVTGADSSTGVLQLEAATPLKDAYSMRVPNNNSGYLSEDFTGVNELFAIFFFRPTSFPANARIAQVRNGSTTVGEISVTTAGVLQLKNAGSTITGTNPTLLVNHTYRIGLHQKLGIAGAALLEAYLIEGDAPFGSTPFATSTAAISGQATQLRFGATNSNIVDATFDDVTLDSSTWPLASTPTGLLPATNYNANYRPRAVALGDFNGDGKLDAAVPNWYGYMVSVLLNDGSGNYPTATTSAEPNNPNNLVTSDFNGDGKLDLAVAAYNYNTVNIRLGDGTGAFSAGTTYTANSSPLGMAVGDFNGDGKPDIVVTNDLANTVTVLFNNGSGAFPTQSAFTVGTNPNAVAVGDLNGDGKIDLVVANRGSNTVSVLLGNGSGSFTAASGSPFAVGSTPFDVALGDVTGDGKLDVAVTNQGSNTVSVLVGLGTGALLAATNYAVGTTPNNVALTDLNGDGMLDMLVSNAGSNNLSVLQGTGAGSFQAVGTYPIGSDPVTIKTGDVNTDGKPDVVVANFFSNSISVLLNQWLFSKSTRVATYSYDGLQRLTATKESPGNSYAYTYDNAGNRTSVQINGGTPTATTYNAANQITNAGFTYDNAGNLTNDGTAAYTYDALNRTTARGTTTYGYNGDGTLVSQVAGGVTTRYTQDLASPLSQVLQTKVGAATATDYLYGLNRLASLNGSTKTWYAADALGSVRRTVADAGTPLGVVNYDPWGTVETGSVPTFGFTGEVQDAASGLVNLRARWYSTGQGRFTSVDAFVGDPEMPYSQHPYAYGYSDPVLYTDATGMCAPGIDPDCDWRTLRLPNCISSWVPIIGQSDCESLGNGDDFNKRAINFSENVGMIGAVAGDFINSLRGMPTHEAERIATTDPVAAALGATFTTVATAGLPMWGARAVLESPTSTLEAAALARLAIARSDIALLSGLTGMAGSGAGQVLGNMLQGKSTKLNWGDMGIAGNIGAVTGWVGPRFTAFMPGSGKVAWWVSKIGTSVLGAVANTAQYGITQFVHGLPITSRGMMISLGAGAFGGLVAGNITSPRFGAFHWENAFRNANVGVGTFFRSLGGSISTNVDVDAAWQTIQNKIGCLSRFLP